MIAASFLASTLSKEKASQNSARIALLSIKKSSNHSCERNSIAFIPNKFATCSMRVMSLIPWAIHLLTVVGSTFAASAKFV